MPATLLSPTVLVTCKKKKRVDLCRYDVNLILFCVGLQI